ncbi:branched-chain amino acid ABC transporter permease [Egibacter rhizosphaerae]|uniref:Branched-chain amino acid ABC transporter permease n=1 Tax=Egibacter rhizosphaerae TaxID=1670831 RepID=A0A411YKT2_9ACTN|nr:branched-chain amino acid ABC transporter permease [Egibacter rhizosphaerae]QBI21791.1 branched-chain amino acid ABC transporter permease [Egibacter rhizosphaerae]
MIEALETIFATAMRSATGPAGAYYALLAIGLNVHFGYTGLLNFGQVGFMLLGAYGIGITVAIVGGPLWAGIIVSLVAAALLALALGLPTLRLRADYLAITTIAAAEILRFVFRASGSRPYTGGSFGLTEVAGGFYRVNPFPPGDYNLLVFAVDHRRLWAMVVGWGLVVLATLFVWALMRSPWGRVVKSIREDEDAARSLGKNAFAYKLQSLVIGGVIGSLGGVLFVLHLQTVQPDAFRPQQTFYAYAALILGGAATTFGPIVGAFLFWFLLTGADAAMRTIAATGVIPPEILSTEAIGAFRLILVGVLIVLLMIYRPQGLLGSRQEMQLDAK